MIDNYVQSNGVNQWAGMLTEFRLVKGKSAPKQPFYHPCGIISLISVLGKFLASRYVIDNYFSPMLSNNGQVFSESSGLSRFYCSHDIIALISVLGKCLCIKMP
jgi:hypothetical protein